MATKNKIGWGNIYLRSYWGNGVETNSIYWGSMYRYDADYREVTSRFEDRVIADGGTNEALGCVNTADFADNNWDYYFRVTDDGGSVESLQCITIE